MSYMSDVLLHEHTRRNATENRLKMGDCLGLLSPCARASCAIAAMMIVVVDDVLCRDEMKSAMVAVMRAFAPSSSLASKAKREECLRETVGSGGDRVRYA